LVAATEHTGVSCYAVYGERTAGAVHVTATAVRPRRDSDADVRR